MLCFAVTLKLFDGTVPPVRARQTVSRCAQRVSHLGNRLSLHLVDALRVRDGECRDRTTLRVQNRKTDGEQATDLPLGMDSYPAARIESRGVSICGLACSGRRSSDSSMRSLHVSSSWKANNTRPDCESHA